MASGVIPSDDRAIMSMLLLAYGTPVYEFEVAGVPRGYVATQSTSPKHKYAMQSNQWAQRVLESFEDTCQESWIYATSLKPAVIYVRPFYGSGNHADPGNTCKKGVDALFYGAPKIKSVPSGDKYVSQLSPFPLYDEERPRTEFFVWFPYGELRYEAV